MSDILLVLGHGPERSLTHALAHRYEAAARAAGARVERLELAQLAFDPVLREGYRGQQPLEPDLVRAQEALRAARHVAFFFPTWWAAPPALVKGFVDRVFLPGFAYAFHPGRMVQSKLLRGRSARLVTTMDAPWWYYALRYHWALHASFVRATLRFVGLSPVHTTTGYGIRSASPRALEKLLRRADHAGRKDARSLARGR